MEITVKNGVNDLLTWCLQNGERGQQLIAEWVGLDENNNPIEMGNVTKSSGKRVKWRCSEGHEWSALISQRTSGRSNCSKCKAVSAGVKNSKPIQGVNDLLTWCLQNGEQGERLIQEWTGITEQVEQEYLEQLKEKELEVSNHEFDDIMDNSKPEIKKISMKEITKASTRKVKWICSKCNHEWISAVSDRTQGRNCPACAGKVIIPGVNDLYNWCLKAGERGQRLIQEWQGLDENNNPIFMNSVAKGSHQKVKWKCSKCNHEWFSTVKDRIYGRNCPKCKAKGTSERNSTPTQGINDLYSWCLQAGEQGQRLIQEWVGLDENENPIFINSVTKGSRKKVKWKCRDCNYEWFSTINNRTNGVNCPACTNQLVIPGKNDLYTWCLQNGERGKRLISEWTGLDEDNNIVCIDSVTRASGKKVQWKCKRGHKWVTTINSRAYGCNCPYCNTKGTSYPEQLLYHSLKQIFPNTISRGTFNNYEYDIAIPELKVCIEYSGYYYHQDKLARDTEKYNLCKKHGVHFIQIYCHRGELFNSEDLTNILYTFNYTEDDLDESGDLFTPNLIIYQQSIYHDNQLKDILSFLLNQFNHSIDEINFDKVTEDAMKFIDDTVDNECESDKSIDEYKGM